MKEPQIDLHHPLQTPCTFDRPSGNNQRAGIRKAGDYWAFLSRY